MHNAARYALGAFAGAAIISGAGIGIAMAGDSDSTPHAVTTAVQAQEAPADGFLARLAAKLGVSEEELRRAIEGTIEETLQRAADEGRLPQETVDQLQDLIDRGLHDPDGGLFGDPEGWGALEADLDALAERLAAFLGTSEEEIRRQLESGMSLADIAEQVNRTPAEIGQSLLQEYLYFLENESVPAEVRTHLRGLTNRLIEMYLDGDLRIDGLFGNGFFGEDGRDP
jgi:AraC-like DNA-binding protein